MVFQSTENTLNSFPGPKRKFWAKSLSPLFCLFRSFHHHLLITRSSGTYADSVHPHPVPVCTHISQNSNINYILLSQVWVKSHPKEAFLGYLSQSQSSDYFFHKMSLNKYIRLLVCMVPFGYVPAENCICNQYVNWCGCVVIKLYLQNKSWVRFGMSAVICYWSKTRDDFLLFLSRASQSHTHMPTVLLLYYLWDPWGQEETWTLKHLSKCIAPGAVLAQWSLRKQLGKGRKEKRKKSEVSLSDKTPFGKQHVWLVIFNSVCVWKVLECSLTHPLLCLFFHDCSKTVFLGLPFTLAAALEKLAFWKSSPEGKFFANSCSQKPSFVIFIKRPGEDSNSVKWNRETQSN